MYLLCITCILHCNGNTSFYGKISEISKSYRLDFSRLQGPVFRGMSAGSFSRTAAGNRAYESDSLPHFVPNNLDKTKISRYNDIMKQKYITRLAVFSYWLYKEIRVL